MEGFINMVTFKRISTEATPPQSNKALDRLVQHLHVRGRAVTVGFKGSVHSVEK